MKRDILLAIAAHTRSLPAHAFNMEIWQNDCGTVGCAIGHAAKAGLVPGLTLTLQYEEQNDGTKISFWTPTFGDIFGTYAVAQALEITRRQVEYLFLAHQYQHPGDVERFATPGAVADRIEQFVTNAEAKP